MQKHTNVFFKVECDVEQNRKGGKEGRKEGEMRRRK